MKDDVYIIGGGPSLKNFDFEGLRYLDTIAVNVAALDVPDPTFCITADSGQFQKLQEGYYKGIDTTWVLVTNPDHCTMKWKNGVFKHKKSGYIYNLFASTMVIKNTGVEGLGFRFNDFRTGYNSGFCAFQLAFLLGYKQIHLLGIDLNDGTHYHNRYGGIINKGSLRDFYLNFVRAIKILQERTQIQVISHSPISKLNSVIPYQLFETPEPPAKGLKPHHPVNPPKHSTTAPGPPRKLIGKPGKPGIKLSILICSLEKRVKSREKLLSILRTQETKEVEILVSIDNGKLTTGEKRNQLLESAAGDYISFVDDDDLVSEDYISKILAAIKSLADCCGFRGEMSNRKGKFVFIHSLQFRSWFTKDEVYYRCPNHLSPVKRELALATGFLDTMVGEDKDFSYRLLPLLKTEEFISGILYYYITR